MEAPEGETLEILQLAIAQILVSENPRNFPAKCLVHDKKGTEFFLMKAEVYSKTFSCLKS